MMESTGKIQNERSFTWEIEKFSTLRTEVGNFIKSPIVSGRRENKFHSSWYLKLFPNGIYPTSRGYISLFLYLNSSTANENFEVEVSYELAFLVDEERRQIERASNKFNHGNNPRIGYPRMIPRVNVMNEFLKEDKLTVNCRIWGFSYHDLETKKSLKGVGDNTVLTSIWEQYGNQEFVDITFLVSGKEFKLHKNVLAANSPVFATMFTNGMLEAVQNMVHITDCKEEAFEEFIKFLYIGKIDNLEEFHYELLSLADKYDVDRLKVKCEESLGSTLSVDNAIKTLRHAHLHSATRLKTETLNFIKLHALEITQSYDWNSLITEPVLIGEVFTVVAAFLDELVSST